MSPAQLRKDWKMDLCYGSIKGAYKASPRPPLGSSDHNTIYLTPMYRPTLKREKMKTREVKLCSEDAVVKLQGCFDCTDWSVFKDSASDIDELTVSVVILHSVRILSFLRTGFLRKYGKYGKVWKQIGSISRY